MTVVSDFYDSLHTRIAAVLTSHVRLPNPYALEQNNAQFLKLGYGLAVREAQNTERHVGCQLSVSRTYEVRITRKFYAREFDGVAKGETEKDLLEDLQLIIDDFEKDPTLNTDPKVKTKYLSDSGINSVFIDQDNYIEISAIFECEYFKDLT